MERVAGWPAERWQVGWPASSGGKARLIRFGSVFIAAFTLLILPQLLWMVARPGAPSPFARLFLRSVAIAAGLRVEVTGPEFERSALLVANHISWTDILVLGGLTRTAFVARDDVRRWPVLGLLARLNATIFVNRAARLSVLDQGAALADGLRRGHVLLFPEGTTGNGADVLPFRPALLGAASECPIQPIAIAYEPRGSALAEFAWDGDKSFLPHLLQVIVSGGAHCRISVLPPIPAGHGDRKVRASRARAMIRATLGRSGS